MKFKSQLCLTSSICLEFFCYIFTLTLDIPFHSVERKRKFFQTPYFECKGKLGFQFLHLFQQLSLSLQSNSKLIRRPAYSLVKKEEKCELILCLLWIFPPIQFVCIIWIPMMSKLDKELSVSCRFWQTA